MTAPTKDAQPEPFRVPIAEQVAATDELRRRLDAAERDVRARMPEPSSLDEHERPAARARLLAALDEARQRVRAEYAAERADDLAARKARHDAAQQAAVAAAEQRAAAARATLDPIPDDEVDPAEVAADDEVAALEQRVAAGDESVTAEQLAAARAAAAGRARFGRLRGVFAARQARRAAEDAEQRAAAAAEEHARAVLGPYTPAQLVPLYDEAVAAVRAYAAALGARNDALAGLGRLPVAERHRGVTVNHLDGPNATRAVVDGHEYRRQDIATHVRRVLAAAGLNGRSLDLVDTTRYARDDRDPAIVAEGRAQLAAAKGRRTA